MSQLGEIYRFEVRHHLRGALFWICLGLFFLLTFLAVVTDDVQIGGSIGQVHRNAPFVILQFLGVMSVIGVFTTTAFVANAVQRDFELGTDDLFFSTPMRQRDYLLGRFLGALTIAFLVLGGVALAVLAGGFMPWVEAERLGPVHLSAYVFALLVLVLPNLFLTGAAFFAVAARTRSMLWTYAAVIAFFVAYGVAQLLLADLQSETWGAMADPFGIAALDSATKYWTVAEKNAPTLPWDRVFLLNRLLWVGVGGLALACTLLTFKLRAAARPGRALSDTDAPVRPAPSARPVAAQRFGGAAARQQFVHQARLEVMGILRSAPFRVILALGVFNIIGNASGRSRLYGTAVYPVTHVMLTTIAGAYGLFAMLLVTFFAGELVFRERSLKLADVYDSLPVRTWVLWSAKLVALVAMVAVLVLVAVATGAGIQAYHGYTHFEPELYFKGVILDSGTSYVLIAVLALFFQVATNHKYVGFLLVVAHRLSSGVLGSLGFDHNLYRYGGTPDTPYSDMNGYGHFVAPLFWFDLYWSLGAVILVVLVHLLWVRGTDVSPAARWRRLKSRLGAAPRRVLALALLAFVVTGAWIFYNTNVLNEYVPSKRREERQAEFEKKYKRHEGLPQPRIAAVKADVDLYPERRAVDIRGSYRLENRTAAPIDTLHLTLDPRIQLVSFAIPGSRPTAPDPASGYWILALEPPLAPGEGRDLAFTLAVRNPGFVNNDSDTHVVANGTFFDSEGYFPHVGYSRSRELQDPNARRKHGLAPVQRLPRLEDEPAHGNNEVSAEADWVTFETTVSTSPDQVAIAPGYLVQEWTAGGRRYFHYAMDAPILAFWSYLSARWEVRRDRWNEVAIEVYHHPGHAYNVDRMIDGVKKSLAYFTASFSPYQHRQMRIVEFPRYASFAQSFPNTVPYSENIGFIARIEDKDDIDYVFYVTAHEVAHQWWAHQAIGARVQGATMLTETLSQYSALMVMEKEYGAEKMRRFLKYELDRYLRGRGGERIEELPLYRNEDQPYIHYNKGSLAMYALRDAIGEEAVNRALARFVRAHRFAGPPYPDSRDLLAELRAVTPPELGPLIADLFETITLHDNRAASATAVPAGDGKFRVTVAVTAKKLRATGAGAETEVPVDDWVDVGVLGKPEPGSKVGLPLVLEKRHLTAPSATFELEVKGEPYQAGIDPLNKLIDRKPEDNVVEVKRTVQ